MLLSSYLDNQDWITEVTMRVASEKCEDNIHAIWIAMNTFHPVLVHLAWLNISKRWPVPCIHLLDKHIYLRRQTMSRKKADLSKFVSLYFYSQVRIPQTRRVETPCHTSTRTLLTYVHHRHVIFSPTSNNLKKWLWSLTSPITFFSRKVNPPAPAVGQSL